MSASCVSVFLWDVCSALLLAWPCTRKAAATSCRLHGDTGLLGSKGLTLEQLEEAPVLSCHLNTSQVNKKKKKKDFGCTLPIAQKDISCCNCFCHNNQLFKSAVQHCPCGLVVHRPLIKFSACYSCCSQGNVCLPFGFTLAPRSVTVLSYTKRPWLTLASLNKRILFRIKINDIL